MLVNLNQEYFNIAVFVVLSVILSSVLLLLSYSISYKKKNDIEKISTYECGFEPFCVGVSSFDVHFYIVGILFIIFDLEVIFLYPWAVYLSTLGGSGFFAIIVFLFILTVGFVYEWQRGALDWTKPVSLVTVSERSPLLKTKQMGYLTAQSSYTGTLISPEPGIFLSDIFFITVVLFFLIYSSVKSQGKNLWFLKKTLLGKQKLITVCLVLAMTFTSFYYPTLRDLSWYSVVFLSVEEIFLSVEEIQVVWWVLFNNTGAITEYNNYLVLDSYTVCIKMILVAVTAIFLIITSDYLICYSQIRRVSLLEFPLIVSFSLFFMLLLVSSFNLFGAYISLEGVTFSLYILAGMGFNSQNSLEASIKYFCLGSLSSGFLLFGISLVFIITKTLNFFELRFLFSNVSSVPLLLTFAFIFIFFGFWFKLSIFPCHVWTPDVYEGVLTPVTLYFATVVKLSVFAFLVRLLFFLLGSEAFLSVWQPAFLCVSSLSIVFGALGALLQTKIKRFVGYTSINQMGYLLIGVSSGSVEGLQASFLYFFFYILMSLGFFIVLLYSSGETTHTGLLFINQLSGFGQKHKGIAIFLCLILFSMAGIPPLAGFFGKFFLFFSAFKAGNHCLVVLGLLTNLVSVFYYLRLIKCMLFEGVTVRPEGHYFFITLDPKVSLIVYFILIVIMAVLLTSVVYLNALLVFFEALALSVTIIPLF